MVDPDALGKALGARLAEARSAMTRYDSFAFQPEEEARGGDDRPGAAEAETAARDFVLVALSAAADPVGFALLRRMASGDTTLADLCAVTGLPRLAVWERLSTLVATGLAGRSLESDTAGLTPAGSALVALVEDATAAAAAEAAG